MKYKLNKIHKNIFPIIWIISILFTFQTHAGKPRPDYEYNQEATLDDTLTGIQNLLDEFDAGKSSRVYMNIVVHSTNFIDFLYKRFSCIAKRPDAKWSGYDFAHHSIAPTFLGPSEYLVRWGENNRYVAGSACQPHACGANGMFIADMENKAISYGLLMYDSFHIGLLDPASTPEFEQEAVNFMTDFANIRARETYEKIHAGELPKPLRMDDYFENFRGHLYLKAPPLVTRKLACDRDPIEAQKVWDNFEAWHDRTLPRGIPE